MFRGKIVIAPGFNCNFNCAHCANAFQKRKKLSPSEIGALVSTINDLGIRRVHFIGGEPTLYLKEIREIIGGIKDRRGLGVFITTNGSFAKSRTEAVSMLSRIPALSKVQLSYDKFHAPFLPPTYVKNLVSASRILDIKFSVLCAVQTPADMLVATSLRKPGEFPVVIQRVLPQGAAAASGAVYSCYGVFEKKTLRRVCPDRNNIVYLCGKGFTLCCSSLVLSLGLKGVCHKSAERLLNSRFYKLLHDFNFGELMEAMGVPKAGLKGEHSSVCNLCEYIFASGKVRT